MGVEPFKPNIPVGDDLPSVAHLALLDVLLLVSTPSLTLWDLAHTVGPRPHPPTARDLAHSTGPRPHSPTVQDLTHSVGPHPHRGSSPTLAPKGDRCEGGVEYPPLLCGATLRCELRYPPVASRSRSFTAEGRHHMFSRFA